MVANGCVNAVGAAVADTGTEVGVAVGLDDGDLVGELVGLSDGCWLG